MKGRCGLCGGSCRNDMCPNRAARASERTVAATHYYCDACYVLAPAGQHRCPETYATQELPVIGMAELVAS